MKKIEDIECPVCHAVGSLEIGAFSVICTGCSNFFFRNKDVEE